MLRFARCTLGEKIFAKCLTLFKGKKSQHCQGSWQTILGSVPSRQFRQTTPNSGRLTTRLQLCQKELEDWLDFEVLD